MQQVVHQVVHQVETTPSPKRSLVRRMADRLSAGRKSLSAQLARTVPFWEHGIPAVRFVLSAWFSAAGRFLSSRRWLVGAVLVTVALLSVLLLARPVPPRAGAVALESAPAFDAVKSFPTGPSSATLRFRPAIAAVNHDFDSGSKSPDQVAAIPTPAADDPGTTTGLSRRLEAVRSRQARGAWLTGKIEEATEIAAAPRGPAKTVRERPLVSLRLPITPTPAQGTASPNRSSSGGSTATVQRPRNVEGAPRQATLPATNDSVWQ